MKVLTADNGKTILTFPIDGSEFRGLDGKAYAEATGVRDTPDALVKRLVRDALPKVEATDEAFVPVDTSHPFAFCDEKDLLRDLRWISKFLIGAEVPDGTSGIKMRVSGRGVTLDVPASATVDRSAGLKVGSRVAVGPSISPKAMMNARGTVESVNGTRAMVRFDASDLDRVYRSTGKRFREVTSIPKASLEIVE